MGVTSAFGPLLLTFILLSERKLLVNKKGVIVITIIIKTCCRMP